jgi:hypothetical protein
MKVKSANFTIIQGVGYSLGVKCLSVSQEDLGSSPGCALSCVSPIHRN